MATERSDKVHEGWRQASEKFDYFITGVTGALCAYITQTFKVQPLSVSPNTAELGALLLLVASVYAGFKRIESIVEVQRQSHNELYIGERLGKLLAKYKGQPLANYATGELMLPDHVEAEIAQLRSAKPKAKANADRFSSLALTCYVWRNRLLAGGFLTLIAAKVWGAYV